MQSTLDALIVFLMNWKPFTVKVYCYLISGLLIMRQHNANLVTYTYDYVYVCNRIPLINLTSSRIPDGMDFLIYLLSFNALFRHSIVSVKNTVLQLQNSKCLSQKKQTNKNFAECYVAPALCLHIRN